MAVKAEPPFDPEIASKTRIGIPLRWPSITFHTCLTANPHGLVLETQLGRWGPVLPFGGFHHQLAGARGSTNWKPNRAASANMARPRNQWTVRIAPKTPATIRGTASMVTLDILDLVALP